MLRNTTVAENHVLARLETSDGGKLLIRLMEDSKALLVAKILRSDPDMPVQRGEARQLDELIEKLRAAPSEE